MYSGWMGVCLFVYGSNTMSQRVVYYHVNAACLLIDIDNFLLY